MSFTRGPKGVVLPDLAFRLAAFAFKVGTLGLGRTRDASFRRGGAGREHVCPGKTGPTPSSNWKRLDFGCPSR